ncbi:MAG: ABC transporter ATP-binding protein [Schleiferiaceae bacterium]
MNPLRIRTENLGKNLGGRWALRRLDLQVAPGEVVGIIGANGAGKSTLLKTLSGLLHPDEGSYEVHGRMASLLEVGTGFHPDLSGRENAYLRGALLGISRAEVRELLPHAAAFAGLEDRLDEPVKYYSSGMQVRLGFALSAHLPAEILLVDEVLAVGDAAFQAKSLAFLESQWRANGRSVVYVAHQLHTVRRICDRVLWLEHGILRMEGSAEAVCDAYLAQAVGRSLTWPEPQLRPGRGELRAVALELGPNWQTGAPAELRATWQGTSEGAIDVRIRVARTDGAPLTVWSSLGSGAKLSGTDGSAVLKLPELALSRGAYRLQLRLYSDGILQDEVSDAADLEVADGLWQGQEYPLPRPMVLQPQSWS